MCGGMPAHAGEGTASASGAKNASSGDEPGRALPHIIVLATGGTIAGKADARSATGYNAGEVSAAQLLESVPGLSRLARISAEQIASIGSQDMNDQVWIKLAHRIRRIAEQHEADGVVVTHGTDTMEETAFFLDEVLRTSMPVVLTGAMRPSTAIGADGPRNLYEAIEVAASPATRGRGVLIVMNDTVESARGATKANTSSVQTFMSPNTGPVGYVDPAGVRYVAAPPAPRHGKPYALPAGDSLPRVDIVYSHSNMGAAQIEHAVADGAKGIVLAGVGGGNTSKQALDAMESAVRQGLVVVRSTRAHSGFVARNVEVDDDRLGFVAALDLNPQKARVLTQLLIANGITAPKQVQQAFEPGR
ncbi:asparaginase [Candidimonas nitroreducens]|uniref:L-asparaginase 2 n=1 Tax=Candidimonas nitroreducens TaxID=683354 RepID=A0A225MWJ3_9BURK|nr:asparaginase [Candidimonas nitroreducens]OWT64190.1 L-asparaginase 2 [Candidimonas nitroreducens]